MRSWMLVVLGIIVSTLIALSLIFLKENPAPPASKANEPAMTSKAPETTPTLIPDGGTHAPSPVVSPAPTNLSPDLTVDAHGLSKATVLITTNAGVIKFKFYPNEAPKTVKRLIELINQGFYNGLTFHRVVSNFVIQGGDPAGNGTGGSGQKLEPEFNSHRHVEGTVAMARGSDPASADSQFYISLGTFPNLDHNYTVFGQVVEGMDVAKKIQIGDKMTSVIIQ